MFYVFLTALLFAVILLYFRIANHYNIIDKPNERSSHSDTTIRGGGIIFLLSVILFFPEWLHLSLSFGGCAAIRYR